MGDVVNLSTVELTVFERLILLGLLPKEGRIMDLKIIQRFQADLGFTEEEHKVLEFRTLESGGVQWNPTDAANRVFTVGPRMMTIVAEVLGELEKTGKLRMEHVGLYEKFVEMKEN